MSSQTYLNIPHMSLITSIAELAPNREIMEIMRPFKLFCSLTDNFYLLCTDSP